VFSIVADAGGSIDVESAVGVGTTFRIRFPLAEGVDESAPEPADDDRSVLGTETVLLVEDQDAVRAVAARALRAYGYIVLVARHGPDALALLRGAGKIDLLLTDLVMPEMPGQELAGRVRALAPDIRVLFMSGYVESPQGQGELDPGTPLVRKPFTGEELARAVRAVLDG
jgi:CheY-like chemotaxis protein